MMSGISKPGGKIENIGRVESEPEPVASVDVDEIQKMLDKGKAEVEQMVKAVLDERLQKGSTPEQAQKQEEEATKWKLTKEALIPVPKAEDVATNVLLLQEHCQEVKYVMSLDQMRLVANTNGDVLTRAMEIQRSFAAMHKGTARLSENWGRALRRATREEIEFRSNHPEVAKG